MYVLKQYIVHREVKTGRLERSVQLLEKEKQKPCHRGWHRKSENIMSWECILNRIIALIKQNEVLKIENERLRRSLDAMHNRALMAELGLKCKQQREGLKK